MPLSINPLKAIRQRLGMSREELVWVRTYSPRPSRMDCHPPDPVRFVRRLEQHGIECRWDSPLWPGLFKFLRQLNLDPGALQRKLTQWRAAKAVCKKNSLYFSKNSREENGR
jgi:hypothetical protein